MISRWSAPVQHGPSNYPKIITKKVITTTCHSSVEESCIQIRRATETAEYRAAGYLRAKCFAKYPVGQASSFARRAFLRMKGDEKWLEIEAAQTNTAIITPLIATIEGEEQHFEFPSLCIPREAPTTPEWIVGTLDINIGVRLPSEELIGRFPVECIQHDVVRKRAYLSNVCTLEEARRRGIAKKLIEVAFQMALDRGVEHLYVHVIHDNIPALRLYRDRCGFEIESEERESTARALNRPRRLLLYKSLVSL